MNLRRGKQWKVIHHLGSATSHTLNQNLLSEIEQVTLEKLKKQDGVKPFITT